ncbi:MAG: hypothetical protein ABI551_24765, partial [Polyangiaceae bacterium]
LRKEQIRNTALRFRFHMILQKFNTYQSYWMRIMRQIEDGTYKRDVLRAKNNQALRRSAPPPKPVEVATATPMRDDFEFDTDLPTRQVDVPALRAKEATSQPFGFEDPTTRVAHRPGASFDEDPTALYLPVVDAKMAAPLPPAPVGTPIARVRLAQADPEKLRALAAQIKVKKPDVEPTAPPRRLVAEAPPIHQPPARSTPDPTAKKPGPPPLKPSTSPAGFRPLAPPLGAKTMGVKPAAPPVPAAPKPAPAAPARPGPPPTKPPTPTAAIAAPPLVPKPAPPPLNRPPTAPGAFKPLAPPMNKPPVPTAATKIVK